jgi:membrane-associated protease RseP (regulator of RpoE activity)
VDVTHFRPYLTGTRKIRIAAGTTFYKDRGYMMSVSLDFHHGTPELEPYGITPLWHGTARYKSAENHFQDFFPPRTVALGADVAAARVYTTTTGHSQVGEFTPSVRALHVVRKDEEGTEHVQRFENTLWKTDCYLNPNRPQFGTWKYARAGWAPGDIVWPWRIDLTPDMWAGGQAELRYETQPYAFEGEAPPDKQINQASHVVRSYLVHYRKPVGLMPAPILRVTGVSKDSNAAKAGMQRGDYFAEYDGTRVDSVDDLRAALRAAAEAGKQRVPVVVYRGAKRIELELDVGHMGINLGG